MLNTRLRKQIEWHFYNYEADERLYKEKLEDIAESGVTSRLDRVGSNSNIGNPTASKAICVETLNNERCWVNVVRNTFNAYRFETEYDIMTKLYIENKGYTELFDEGLSESTFWYWREKWLTTAYMWAKEFKLL